MSAATFKIELKQPARKDGTFALRIRITRFRKHAYWNLGRYIEQGNLNKAPKERLKNWVIKHDDAPQINDAIYKALKGLGKVADDNPAATATGIKELYEKELNPAAELETDYRNFFSFAEEIIERQKSNTFHTGKTLGYFIKEFKAVIGENTPIAELFNTRNTVKFIKYLKEKGNSQNTIKAKLRKIRDVYDKGRKEKALPDIGDIHQDIRIPLTRKKKERPTAEQIRQFIAYQPQNELQAMAKTVAMLQYLLQGARVGEALTLEWTNINPDYVEYLPQKNASKPKFIPRSALLNNLLEQQAKAGRYVLPYLGEDFPELPAKKQYYRKNRIVIEVNAGLKEIAKALKIPIALSSHMFRHAFADAVIATGANPHQAAALLGHSNPAITERYIKDLKMQDVSPIALSIFNQLEDQENKEANTEENLGKP